MLRIVPGIIQETVLEYMSDRIPRLGAAIAFYMTFSLAPTLMVVVAIAGFIFGRQAAEGQLFNQIKSVVGNDVALTLQTLLSAAEKQGAGVLASSIAVITVLIGALGVFSELQDSLNTILGHPKDSGGMWKLLKQRFLVFLLVIAFGLLLLASLALSTAMNVVNVLLDKHEYSVYVPAILKTYFPHLFSLVLVTIVFAMIYHSLPDTKVPWRSVWVGSFAGSVLFAIGKTLLGLYLAHVAATSVYGAAASLVVLMLWNYYTAQIILVGAELMKIHARRRAARIASV
jgi:membrane protein